LKITRIAIPVLMFLMFISIFGTNLISQNQPNKTVDSFPAHNSVDLKNYKFRSLKNEAFGYGERLDYKVGYKFITAGTGYLQIGQKPVYRNNRESYHVQFEVRSLESLDFLYRVRDAFTSILDVSGIFPWEFNQRVREGNYKRDSKATFDQVKNKAYVKDKSYNIPEYVHDIISAFYYVRTLDLSTMKKGTTLYMKNFFEDTTFTLGVKIHGRSTCEVDAGTFNCILLEPLVVQGGLFQSEGSIFIWLTDDDRKMPVKVATKIPIGFVEAKLTSYKGLRGPLKSKVK
jgi:hypothetical protein